MKIGIPMVARLIACLSLLAGLNGCSLRLNPRIDPFYRAVLSQNSQHVAAIYAQGQDLLTQGRYAEASPYFARLTRLEPDQPRGWIGLGQCRLEEGHYHQAQSAFSRAWSLRPSSEAGIGLAAAQMLAGDLDGAAAQSALTREACGESAGLLRLEGDLAYLRQDLGVAAEKYRQSLKSNPNQPGIANRLKDIEAFVAATAR
jgi:cytochrome c-type biogenesis protein CcmH/NrfG